jgi:DNA-directed RNA polymerase specialized sigma subunit
LGLAYFEIPGLRVEVELPDEVVREYIQAIFANQAIDDNRRDDQQKVLNRRTKSRPPSNLHSINMRCLNTHSKKKMIKSVFREGEELYAEEILERLEKKGIRIKQKTPRALSQWITRNMEHELQRRKIGSKTLYSLPGTPPKKLTEKEEKEALRLYFMEKIPISEVARKLKVSESEISKLIRSDKGQLYARVNGSLDVSKIDEALKKDHRILAEVTADAEGVEA